ncbi:hypothetical protein SPRG_13100 [Saprolegnia parasitica CBS 223.65]|uniref:Uncharacterized protein n=1 Tax=Saprolegnia parasitica (strain CBS 223.65) TaxID=695850 RepID=A0A067BUG6_SAPPC|nr:hypothetical protein SPRG_13100 [Saprolegnia parasitica CBS 223.65]KDO21918.1 hypothetical protein SPRG_13100 [Saprolegnia parasitica CBS 223.65]|eukprot:XP_012207360.1 hypothetical protein SPRG_13100 [Saprolegnia parasitica CBS 223.65]
MSWALCDTVHVYDRRHEQAFDMRNLAGHPSLEPSSHWRLPPLPSAWLVGLSTPPILSRVRLHKLEASDSARYQLLRKTARTPLHRNVRGDDGLQALAFSLSLRHLSKDENGCPA